MEIEWNNSECFAPGDHIKFRGKTGIVTEQIHQYIHTDIPGMGWINTIQEGKYMVRGVPKTCKRCKHGYGYSCCPLFCHFSQDTVMPDDTCQHWEMVV